MTAIPEDSVEAATASTPDPASGRAEGAVLAAAARVSATVIEKPRNAETARRNRSRRPLTREIDPS